MHPCPGMPMLVRPQRSDYVPRCQSHTDSLRTWSFIYFNLEYMYPWRIWCSLFDKMSNCVENHTSLGQLFPSNLKDCLLGYSPQLGSNKTLALPSIDCLWIIFGGNLSMKTRTDKWRVHDLHGQVSGAPGYPANLPWGERCFRRARLETLGETAWLTSSWQRMVPRPTAILLWPQFTARMVAWQLFLPELSDKTSNSCPMAKMFNPHHKEGRGGESRKRMRGEEERRGEAWGGEGGRQRGYHAFLHTNGTKNQCSPHSCLNTADQGKKMASLSKRPVWPQEPKPLTQDASPQTIRRDELRKACANTPQKLYLQEAEFSTKIHNRGLVNSIQ